MGRGLTATWRGLMGLLSLGFIFSTMPRDDEWYRHASGAVPSPLLFLPSLTHLTTACRAEEPTYPHHYDLTFVMDDTGNPQPIKTVADWERRRAHVLRAMQTVMGKVPGDAKRIPLEMKKLESTPLEGFTRHKIEYRTEPHDVVRAYLFIPTAATATSKRAAVLCLHQTTNIGKQEPSGLGGNPNLHYALHLAQRGYVTLAPDYPSFGEHAFNFADPKFGYISGSMKAIWDNMRAIDLLQSLPEVDGERIGCMGHSLGGHNTMFTAVFDPRIKVLVSNCGFTRFHKYYAGKLAGWTSARYMPLIAQTYHNNPDEVPFDFPEIVAAFAPRPFLASSPVGDGNFEVSGVKDSIAAALPIYALYGKANHLQANYPECGHDFPEAVRKTAYDFFDQHLAGK